MAYPSRSLWRCHKTDQRFPTPHLTSLLWTFLELDVFLRPLPLLPAIPFKIEQYLLVISIAFLKALEIRPLLSFHKSCNG